MKRYEVSGVYSNETIRKTVARDISSPDLTQRILLEAVAADWCDLSIGEYETCDNYVDPLLIQALASVMHGSWKGWMEWMFQCLDSPEREEHLRRWKNQAERNYAELSQAERKSDVEEAKKYLETVYANGLDPSSLSLLSYAKLFDEAIKQCAIPAEFIHSPNSANGVRHVVGR